MDKKYIQENEIDIKYLRGQLAEDELEQFEIYLMEHPEAIESLSVQEALITTAGAALSVDESMNTDSDLGFIERVINWKPIALGSMATSFCLLCLSAFLSFVSLNQKSSGEIDIQFIDSLRGAQSNAVEFKFKKDAFSFFGGSKFSAVLETGDFSGATFNVHIQSRQEDKAQKVEALDRFEINADRDGRVAVLLDSRNYPPGRYQIFLTSRGRGEKTYYFNIAIK